MNACAREVLDQNCNQQITQFVANLQMLDCIAELESDSHWKHAAVPSLVLSIVAKHYPEEFSSNGKGGGGHTEAQHVRAPQRCWDDVPQLI